MNIDYIINYKEYNFNFSYLNNVINMIFNNYKYQYRSLLFTFLNEEELLKINQDFLNHDYYTDVITFNVSDDDFIEGEVFISIDRAIELNTNIELELNRYIIHACLHLVGFNDFTKKEKIVMTNLENFYLNKIVSRGTV